jgi:type IV pilus biogenesis protein CpaD/CtpE
MFRISSNHAAALLLALALPLAGCAADNYFEDEAFEPYGGSKQHPIRVVNGKAVVDECGKWPKNLADTSDNDLSYNHGCAVQANIAAMAADPKDLVMSSSTDAPSLADVSYTAIDKIRVKPSAGGSGGGASASSN